MAINDNNHNTDMDYNYGDQLYRTVNKRENLNNRFYPELTIPIMYSNNEVEDGMSISTRIPIPIPMGGNYNFPKIYEYKTL